MMMACNFKKGDRVVVINPNRDRGVFSDITRGLTFICGEPTRSMDYPGKWILNREYAGTPRTCIYDFEVRLYKTNKYGG